MQGTTERNALPNRRATRLGGVENRRRLDGAEQNSYGS